jgi:hypothetical protein
VQGLGLGLVTTKPYLKDYLERKMKDEELMYKITIEFLISLVLLLVGKIVLEAGRFGKFLEFLKALIYTHADKFFEYGSSFITDLIYQYFVEPNLKDKYTYLRENAFTPLKLLRLIEIINYDLSLLNFEIKVWDQLSDGTKWGGGKPKYYYY